MQSRLNELIEPKSVRRTASYVNELSANDVNKLAQALNERDSKKMTNIISNNTREGFIGRVCQVDAYEEFVEELSRELITLNRGKLDDKNKQYEGAGTYKPITPEIPQGEAYVIQHLIRQRSKKGNVYQKEKPTKFSVAETTFLKRNKNMKPKDLTRKFNQYFTPRSQSSIKTKRGRLKEDENQ
jgi:hypothetical protein